MKTSIWTLGLAMAAKPAISRWVPCFVGICALALAAPSARAGFRTVAQLFPYDDGHRTPRFSGIAFDGSANPWVIDSLSWEMKQYDLDTGSVLNTYTPAPPSLYNDTLEWDPATRTFYTMNQFAFYAIDQAAHSRTTLGSFPYFNWASLAMNPATGVLWLGTDGGAAKDLWKVDRATGQLTYVRPINTSAYTLIAVAIDNAGNYFMAAQPGLWYSGPQAIYSLDPTTGNTQWVTDSTDQVQDLIKDCNFDPISGRCYAIQERRSVYPWDYYLVEITGIPEPGALGVLTAMWLTLRRRAATLRPASKESCSLLLACHRWWRS